MCSDVDGCGIRIEVLDGCVVGRGEDRLTVPLACQRLVAYLALQTRPVSRSDVASRLWYENPRSSTQACLRSALWRLRDVCGGCDLVEATRTHLSLNPDVPVDLRAQVTMARDMLTSPAGVADLDLHLLQGELLPGWHDEWVLVERDRLRQLRLHAIEAFARHLTTLGRHGAAVEATFAVIRADPLRETAHQILIETYLAEGNRVDAMRHYEQYKRLLERKLGLRPDPALARMLCTTSVTAPSRVSNDN